MKERAGLSLKTIWLDLMLLTLASTAIAEAASHVTVSILAVFAIAAIKAELVLSHFMEAGRAEMHWIWVYRFWIGGVATMLIIGNLI